MVNAVYSQNPKQHVKTGIQFVENGFYNDAIESFSTAIMIEPEYVDAYIERGNLYLKLDSAMLAAKDFQKAGVLAGNSDYYYKAAEIYHKLGAVDDALNNLSKSLELKNKHYESQLLYTQILIEKSDYGQAYEEAEKLVSIKDYSIGYYYKGLIEKELKMFQAAEKSFEKSIIKDKNFLDAFIAQADLQLSLGKIEYAFENCSYVIFIDAKRSDAYLIRSQIYLMRKEFEKAISDISKAISVDPENDALFYHRGNYYLEYGHFQNAINDYTKAILINPASIDAYKNRANAFEQIGNNKLAVHDYNKIMEIGIEDNKELKEYVKDKLYELNKENNKPRITLVEPADKGNYSIKIPRNSGTTVLNLKIEDQNEITDLKINGEPQTLPISNRGSFSFEKSLDLSSLEFITISATDVYGNIANATYTIEKIEINPPRIEIETPYAANGIISITDDEKYLYLEGIIWDENKIQSIKVNDINASYAPSENNPKFTATIDITNKKNIIITASDIYGNTQTELYSFSKTDNQLTQNNPMGKTWVVLIENSDYKEFSNLFGPKKDIESLNDALAHYQINKTIHKKNMSRAEMERFFAIELRDLVRANNVESLLIWYAGHGKYIDENGYWVPVDAKLNDEYFYYNVNALKASLYSYTSLKHLLVITDACEAGPSCNVAMRGFPEKSCSDEGWFNKRSSQILTSSNTEAASDNSLFTKAFVNTLQNNIDYCISIDKVAQNISIILNKNSTQKPVFGKIMGLDDQDGTFFFVTR